MESTYETMTEEHLGDYATSADLAAFREACKIAELRWNWTAAEATDYVWSNGDFYPRVVELLGGYPAESGMFRGVTV